MTVPKLNEETKMNITNVIIINGSIIIKNGIFGINGMFVYEFVEACVFFHTM
jgi:hypothetical protein